MKKAIRIALTLLMVTLCVACDFRTSIIDDVKIENVDTESYRPENYDGPTGIEGASNWAGFYINGDITNNTNKTFNDVRVIVRYYNKADMYIPSAEKEYFLEGKIFKLNPNETEQFKVNVNYEKLNVKGWGWAYDWEIHDVVLEK